MGAGLLAQGTTSHVQDEQEQHYRDDGVRHPHQSMTPAGPELAERDGIAYALFMPDAELEGGVLVLHGAGSAKESHFDFARNAAAHGLAALAYDAPGHGRSGGGWGPAAIDHGVRLLGVLRERGCPQVALRGSSMGGFSAILTAAKDGNAAAVAAICPAPEDLLLRGVRADRFEFELDRRVVEPWLENEVSLSEAAASLAPRTALLLMHAEGDEQVPADVSRELYGVAGRPKRLLLMPGGHHRSLQHDMEMQAETIRFLLRAVRGELS
jgi:pimeloyl-ACP methyl ester carboxylesterase